MRFSQIIYKEVKTKWRWRWICSQNIQYY